VHENPLDRPPHRGQSEQPASEIGIPLYEGGFRPCPTKGQIHAVAVLAHGFAFANPPRRMPFWGLGKLKHAPPDNMHIGQRVAIAGMVVSGSLAVIKDRRRPLGHSTAVVRTDWNRRGDVFASALCCWG